MKMHEMTGSSTRYKLPDTLNYWDSNESEYDLINGFGSGTRSRTTLLTLQVNLRGAAEPTQHLPVAEPS
jgi:hypothetical protein